MKMQITAVILMLLILTSRALCSSVENFTNSVAYIAPTNVYMHDYSGDDYPTPFTIGGSLIQYDAYANSPDPDSTVQFDLAMACYSSGKDGVVFHETRPSDLKKDFENYYRDVFTNMPSAKIGKLDGLTTVSSTASMPAATGTWFFHSSWIQIETNIVVKVTVNSYNAQAFNSLTNSLKSVKVDKQRILKIVASQFQKGIALPIPRMVK